MRVYCLGPLGICLFGVLHGLVWFSKDFVCALEGFMVFYLVSWCFIWFSEVSLGEV